MTRSWNCCNCSVLYISKGSIQYALCLMLAEGRKTDKESGDDKVIKVSLNTGPRRLSGSMTTESEAYEKTTEVRLVYVGTD
jgi:hypothetical protein